MVGQEEKKREDTSAMEDVNTSSERDGGKASVENSQHESMDDSARLDEKKTSDGGQDEEDAGADKEEEEHGGLSGEGGAEDEEEEYAFEDENENENEEDKDGSFVDEPKKTVRFFNHLVHTLTCCVSLHLRPYSRRQNMLINGINVRDGSVSPATRPRATAHPGSFDQRALIYEGGLAQAPLGKE
jgi:hypothetical protein